jgi:hypothetical protein
MLYVNRKSKTKEKRLKTKNKIKFFSCLSKMRGYLNVVRRSDATPKLRNPNEVPHDQLIPDEWYMIDDTIPYVRSIVKIRTPATAVNKASYFDLEDDGTLDPEWYRIDEDEKVYKCEYTKCQDTEMAKNAGVGGRRLKRSSRRNRTRRARKNRNTRQSRK